MEFILLFFYETELHAAVKNQDVEIVKCLLAKENIDVNIQRYKTKRGTIQISIVLIEFLILFKYNFNILY